MISNPKYLPEPLSEKETEKLLNKKEESWARSKLIDHHLKLVVGVVEKLENKEVPAEDLVSIATIGLIKAVNGYELKHNKTFKEYAVASMIEEINRYLAGRKKWYK